MKQTLVRVSPMYTFNLLCFYNPDSKQKYPVVYVLDGEVFLPTVYNVHRFYSGGFMPEMIIVGISNAKNRVRDLTTSKVTEMYGMPFKQENGEADNFRKFIEKELIPFIESKDSMEAIKVRETAAPQKAPL